VSELSDPRCKLQTDQSARVVQENEMTADNHKEADQPTSVGAGNDETTVVPPPTGPGPELAWSLADDVDTAPVGRQPWGLAWGQAAVFLSIGAVVALVIAVVGWTIGRSDHDPQPLPLEVHPTVAAVAVSTSAAPAVVLAPTTVTVQAAPTTVTVQAPAPPPKTTIVTAQAAPSTVTMAPTVSEEPTVTRAAAPPQAKEFGPFEASDDQRLLDWLLAHGWTITNPPPCSEQRAHALPLASEWRVDVFGRCAADQADGYAQS
jgi:hypothetical protein